MSWSTKGGGPSGPWGQAPKGSGPPAPPPSGDGPTPQDFEDAVAEFIERVRKFFSGDGEHRGRSIAIVALLIALLWLGSGIYRVGPDEQGVVLRFGAVHRTVGPGLHYHMPAPIESVYTPKVTATNQIEVGTRVRTTGSRGGEAVPEESLMLTGDENIVDIHFTVQWKIRNAGEFLFNVRNQEATVKSLAESAMREVIGQSDVATALSDGDGKFRIELATKKLIQDTLDLYKAGIQVVKVNMGKTETPAEVVDAFRDVQRAQTDQERARNEAEAYHNDIIPRARGLAEQMVQDAQAYKQKVIAVAEGEASRFVAIYKQYKDARDVTRKRLYLETMEQVLEGMDKVIVDSKSTQGVLPYLPLPALKQSKPKDAP